jgi:hypothetical protein
MNIKLSIKRKIYNKLNELYKLDLDYVFAKISLKLLLQKHSLLLFHLNPILINYKVTLCFCARIRPQQIT